MSHRRRLAQRVSSFGTGPRQQILDVCWDAVDESRCVSHAQKDERGKVFRKKTDPTRSWNLDPHEMTDWGNQHPVIPGGACGATWVGGITHGIRGLVCWPVGEVCFAGIHSGISQDDFMGLNSEHMGLTEISWVEFYVSPRIWCLAVPGNGRRHATWQCRENAVPCSQTTNSRDSASIAPFSR